MRAVGSGLGGCGALEDLAGQSALDDEAEDEDDSKLCELDKDDEDEDASCAEIRASTQAGAADTTPRVATKAAKGMSDVMAVTFRPCNNKATLGL